MFRSCESIDQAPHGCWIDGTGDQRQPDECRETWTHRIAAPLGSIIPFRAWIPSSPKREPAGSVCIMHLRSGSQCFRLEVYAGFLFRPAAQAVFSDARWTRLAGVAAEWRAGLAGTIERVVTI
jgi:hypothetical protein